MTAMVDPSSQKIHGNYDPEITEYFARMSQSEMLSDFGYAGWTALGNICAIGFDDLSAFLPAPLKPGLQH